MKVTRRAILKALENKAVKIICTHLDSGYCSQVEMPFVVTGEYREHLIRMYNQNNKMFRIYNNNEFSCLYDNYIIEG
ncbi:hypothetical protein KST88_02595 [Fusobacterium nucleatum]|uniref:hypothetical protein n=1 Tax=Fusobacterium nucleatum TaxID=851 RepID=UPI0030CF9BDD